MVDPTLAVPPGGALLFHLKQAFWLYAWPAVIGFMTIVGYQALARLVMMGNLQWPVTFGFASAVSMLSLFGWALMARGTEMIPFYGCGVGLASALMSRIYAVIGQRHPRLKIRIPRIIWRGDAAGIEEIRRLAQAQRAAR